MFAGRKSNQVLLDRHGSSGMHVWISWSLARQRLHVEKATANSDMARAGQVRMEHGRWRWDNHEIDKTMGN